MRVAILGNLLWIPDGCDISAFVASLGSEIYDLVRRPYDITIMFNAYD
jgi:hypothetical protein